MTSELQTIRIFLASSAELKADRQAFEQFIARRNKDWSPRGIFLHLDIWEDLSTAMSPTRSQDEYNWEVDRCDIFVLLFWTKVGRYTVEEFERAHARLIGGDGSAGVPKIFTYFKTTLARASREDTQTLWAFQDRLAELKHFPAEYETSDKLNLEFGVELDRLVSSGLIRLDGLGDLVDANLQRREWQAIREAYLDWLRRECDCVELLGLDLKESRNVGLGHVYVPAVTNQNVKGDHKDVDLKKPPYLLLDNLGRSPLYVPGAAGSGKSTFCRWLALVVAEGQVPVHRRIASHDKGLVETLPRSLAGRMPVLFFLRQFPRVALTGTGRWTRSQFESRLVQWVDDARPGGLLVLCFATSLRPVAVC